MTLDPTDGECVTGLVKLLSQRSFIEALDFVRSFMAQNNVFTARLMEVFVLYKMGKFGEAIALFQECVMSDKSASREIFDIEPELLNINEFVLLCEE